MFEDLKLFAGEQLNVVSEWVLTGLIFSMHFIARNHLKRAADIRLVTVLIPNNREECAVIQIKASNCVEDTDIVLYFADGYKWKLDEKCMKGK